MNGFVYTKFYLTGLTGFSGSFCLHQFPEEIDETQSTFGGEKNFNPLVLY
jgi:hypothetical protein